MRDGNLNWVKVTVARPGDVVHVHAAIAKRLHRRKLRPPVGNVILVEEYDLDASEAANVVAGLLKEEFGAVDWIEVEIGYGNLEFMYGDGQ